MLKGVLKRVCTQRARKKEEVCRRDAAIDQLGLAGVFVDFVVVVVADAVLCLGSAVSLLTLILLSPRVSVADLVFPCCLLPLSSRGVSLSHRCVSLSGRAVALSVSSCPRGSCGDVVVGSGCWFPEPCPSRSCFSCCWPPPLFISSVT